MGISKNGTFIEEKQSKKESIRTLKETSEITGLSPQQIAVIEKRALQKVVIKAASITGNYLDGFKLALEILKFRYPEELFRKLPEPIQNRIKSAVSLDGSDLVYKPDFNTDLELLRKSKIID
jgi:hypothetical protein